MDFKELRAKANEGDAAAQVQLGTWFYEGRDVEQSFYYAVKWFERAALQDFGDAYYWLGLCHENGEGCDEDIKKAFQFYNKAMELGSKDAFGTVSGYYEYGLGGVEKDLEKAADILQNALGQGFDNYLSDLGTIYSEMQEYQKANECYEKAKANNEPYAFYALAHSYCHGQGVEKDVSKAKELYTQGALLGSPLCMSELGDMNYYSFKALDGNANYNEALKWYKMALDYYDQNDKNSFHIEFLLPKVIRANSYCFGNAKLEKPKLKEYKQRLKQIKKSEKANKKSEKTTIKNE